MSQVMPSQVVQTIDELFQHARNGIENENLTASHSSHLLGILTLVRSIPQTLIAVPPGNYSDLVLAISTMEMYLGIWSSGRTQGGMDYVKGQDAITVIRRVLALCPDEYPPTSTTDLLFIKEDDLRESIRNDIGTANRALTNAEWKAATVLAGACIEALLHWRLQEPSPGTATIKMTIDELVASKAISKNPNSNMDRWELHEFIEVANHLGLLKPDTTMAAKLAQHFRNLIHPGRAARLNQTCDRATAYSAIGALEHVIRDLG